MRSTDAELHVKRTLFFCKVDGIFLAFKRHPGTLHVIRTVQIVMNATSYEGPRQQLLTNWPNPSEGSPTDQLLVGYPSQCAIAPTSLPHFAWCYGLVDISAPRDAGVQLD